LFAGGRCFDRIDGAPDFKDVTPRFAAVYDIRGDGRTALKFAANRYNQPMLMDFVNRLNPIAAVSDSRAWRAQSACAANNNIGCDLNGDLIPQIAELGPSSGFPLGTTSRYSEDIKRPVSNEFAVELQHQLPGDILASGGYTHRQTRRNFGQRNMAVPTETYVPVTVTEVNSGRAVTVYNQAPALRGRNDNVFSNESQLDTNYHGGDITLNRRMQNRWSMIAGASWGKTTGDILGGNLNDPNSSEFRKGRRQRRASLQLSGVRRPVCRQCHGTAQCQRLPGDDGRVGGQQHRGADQVTQSVVQPRATERLPNVFSRHELCRNFRQGGCRSSRAWTCATSPTMPPSWRGSSAGTNLSSCEQHQHGRMLKLGFQLEF
jgi:hypothetical protein